MVSFALGRDGVVRRLVHTQRRVGGVGVGPLEFPCGSKNIVMRAKRRRRDRPMLKDGSRAFLILSLTLASTACGGGESPAAPTPQAVRASDTLSGPIAANSTSCWGFTSARAGAVSAGVTPASIRVILAAGSCSAPGQTLAEKDGEVSNIETPAGMNHVTLSNQGVTTSFTLTLTYWH